MSKEISAFYAGWIKTKDETIWTNNFQKILSFYLLSTPCLMVSSSSSQVFGKKWDKNVWKNAKLKNVLLSVASLIPKSTYITVLKPDDMTRCLSAIGLNGNFQTQRSIERICFVKSRKCAEFLDILYYIRCALAHGRFQIYTDSGERVYVLESGRLNKTSGEFIVLTRMILKETTLLKWAEIIDAGQDSINLYYNEAMEKLREGIIVKIRSEKKITKKQS